MRSTGSAVAARAARGVVAVVAAHQCDDEAEHRRLDQARADVPQLQEVQRVADIDGRVELQHPRGHQPAAGNANGVGHDGQQGHHQDAGQKARADQVAERVGRQGAHGVDLFGRAHGPDLGGDGRGDPSGQHQGRQHRPELAGDPQRHDLRHDLLGVEAPAAGIDVERQRRSGEHCCQADHRQGEIADLAELAPKLSEEQGRGDHGRYATPSEQGDRAGGLQHPQGRAAYGANRVHATSPR